MKNRYVKGMTLVEVIIVVAIIGILSAVAIPSYNWYLEKADVTAAKTGLVGVGQILAKRKLVTNLTAAEINAAVSAVPVDKDIAAKYTFSATCGSNHAQCDAGNTKDTVLIYALYAVPKSGVSRTKAVWMDDQGNAYICKNSSYAESRGTGTGCDG